MQKDLIFLDENGKLTMTSAAYYRNLAAAKANTIIQKINGIRLVSKEVALIGESFSKTQIGNTTEEINKIPELLAQAAQYQGFEAWLNEAIQAKQRLLDEASRYNIRDWAKDNDVEFPVEPVRENVLTEDEYLSTLSVKDRNRYYMLVSEAALIGKFIHKDCPLDRAIAELSDAQIHPIKESLNGRDTILHKYTPSVDEDDAMSLYFTLQNKHRELQAQINGLKENMNKAIQEDSTKKLNAYIVARDNYNNQYQALAARYEKDKNARSEAIAKLKIVIPKHYEELYTKLCMEGK